MEITLREFRSTDNQTTVLASGSVSSKDGDASPIQLSVSDVEQTIASILSLAHSNFIDDADRERFRLFWRFVYEYAAIRWPDDPVVNLMLRVE